MSDALCGPSNPLQHFKQQTQLDRSLQQDRLAARHSPAQGFRSHNPNSALIDAEFEAFQAGVPNPELLHHHPPPAFSSLPSQSPSWATDFQRLQISGPSMIAQSHVAQSGPATQNWAQSFQQHMGHHAPRAQTSSPSPQAFQYQARYGGMGGYQNGFATSSFAPNMQVGSGKGKEAVLEQFDEAAFERAFDQAREDMMADVEQEPEFVERTYLDPADDVDPEFWMRQMVAEANATTENEKAVEPIDADRIRSFIEANTRDLNERLDQLVKEHEPVQEQRTKQEEEDALAATAQELLEKVEHNQTDKFRNSQFLSLMRKLRDREMKVEGDQMVETDVSSSTVAAEAAQQPLNAARNDALRFDNSEQRPSPLPSQIQRPTVDIRPPEYGQIPSHEQDHDAGRLAPPDGQEVVDLLSRPSAPTDDIGTSAFSAPQGPFYADLRPESSSLSDMLYGANGTVSQNIDWERWDVRN